MPRALMLAVVEFPYELPASAFVIRAPQIRTIASATEEPSRRHRRVTRSVRGGGVSDSR